MGDICSVSKTENIVKESGNEAAVDQRSVDVILGDLIWVKPSGSSWWPAQIVDENCVSDSAKSGIRSTGNVLVRLYGSYTYMYVDPKTCRTEFENILEQHDGSYMEILKKSLEEGISCCKSGKSKRNRTRSEGTQEARGKRKKLNGEQLKPVRFSTRKVKSVTKNQNQTVEKNEKGAKGKNRDQDGGLAKLERNSPSETPKSGSVKKSQELSARRMKVMQTLGLVAPSGSPFHQSKHVYAKLVFH